MIKIAGRDLGDSLCQLAPCGDGKFGRGVAELGRLVLDGAYDARVAKPKVQVDQLGCEIEVAFAVRIPEHRALAPRKDNRAARFLGRPRVQQIPPVSLEDPRCRGLGERLSWALRERAHRHHPFSGTLRGQEESPAAMSAGTVICDLEEPRFDAAPGRGRRRSLTTAAAAFSTGRPLPFDLSRWRRQASHPD